jgi:hypothetical protein
LFYILAATITSDEKEKTTILPAAVAVDVNVFVIHGQTRTTVDIVHLHTLAAALHAADRQ